VPTETAWSQSDGVIPVPASAIQSPLFPTRPRIAVAFLDAAFSKIVFVGPPSIFRVVLTDVGKSPPLLVSPTYVTPPFRRVLPH